MGKVLQELKDKKERKRKNIIAITLIVQNNYSNLSWYDLIKYINGLNEEDFEELCKDLNIE